MLNREKYAEEILNIACDGYAIGFKEGKVVACDVNFKCADGDFFTHENSCIYNRKSWANSEYIEPPVDWSKVSVDTPILVRQSESNEWERRYFAKYKNNMVYAWKARATSWSAEDQAYVCDWKYAKLAESEESHD